MDNNSPSFFRHHPVPIQGRYLIVTAQSEQELVRVVQLRMDEGYRPTGGLVWHWLHSPRMCQQAMVFDG